MPIAPGTQITIRAAARRYDLHHGTLARWVRRGLVTVLQPSPGQGLSIQLDENSVAAISARYQENPGQGKRTIDTTPNSVNVE